jgi:uncharacterized FAD-dependent dehydrogenase
VYEIQVRILAQFIHSEIEIKKIIAQQAQISVNSISDFRVIKRSVDARQKTIYYQLKVEYTTEGKLPESTLFNPIPLSKKGNKKKVIVIGAGPAGLFAAIQLLQTNCIPIVLERGKNVRDRRRDLAKINKEHIVNPESNYCFGEGGAGTYSDGKLYTRSDKRGDIHEILQWLIYFGANPNIFIESHPHIGTNKLPKIIENIRNYILTNGGEVHFESKVTDLIIHENNIKGVVVNNNNEIIAQNVILATGHSSRDIFNLLNRKKILIESKPFALGVRIEHPQDLINEIQYKCNPKPDYLPPASYSLVTQTNLNAVFSFCMCPGGIIAPCATAPGEIVTNGWSPSKRNNPYANSGIVVAIDSKDWKNYTNHGALAALQFQKDVEQKAFKFGGGGQTAPAQRMIDFVEGKLSSTLPQTSYQPGLNSVISDEVLPKVVAQSLRMGLKIFGKKIPSYYTNDAVLHLTESRTSSPVKIPRDPKSLQHPQINGLFPCGEGAGYAGGIMSAAIDGIKCAKAITL